ncbi:MAG: RNA polymerase sigma factor [Desulfomonile tiedjei]|nr:RNA polymerase sigma factor [Desulfomonile tiedjei]
MKISDGVTDEQLVQQAQGGSEAAFNTLVERYTTLVYRLAYNITNSPQEAEDIVQETFLRVFRHLDGFSPSKASFKTWLLTIARNQSINVFSALKRKALRFLGDSGEEDRNFHQADNPFSSPEQDSETLLGSKQEYRKVELAIDSLPQRQREALMLKAQENLSYEEIAEVMKTSVSSVESLIFRARKRLMEILEE